MTRNLGSGLRKLKHYRGTPCTCEASCLYRFRWSGSHGRWLVSKLWRSLATSGAPRCQCAPRVCRPRLVFPGARLTYRSSPPWVLRLVPLSCLKGGRYQFKHNCAIRLAASTGTYLLPAWTAHHPRLRRYRRSPLWWINCCIAWDFAAVAPVSDFELARIRALPTHLQGFAHPADPLPQTLTRKTHPIPKSTNN